MLGNLGTFLSAIRNILLKDRYLLRELVGRELKNRNQGSILGVFWLYIEPLLMLAVLYGIFSSGLKSGAKMSGPFEIYLITGLSFWYFISDSIIKSSNVFVRYSYLVKKMKFQHEYLLFTVLISELVIHIFFWAIIFILSSFYFGISTNFFLSLYYLFSASVLIIAISLITSSVSPFLRDVKSFVGLAMKLGFWGTPIFWNLDQFPIAIQKVLKLNPFFYLIQGYRDSFMYGNGIFDRLDGALYYWCFTIILFFLGIYIFYKLKPHVAEVI